MNALLIKPHKAVLIYPCLLFTLAKDKMNFLILIGALFITISCFIRLVTDLNQQLNNMKSISVLF